MPTGRRRISNTPQAIYDRKWYAANPEKKRAAARKWQAANPEKVSASCRKRYAANPEKSRARCRKWHAANSEKVSATHRKREAANPHARIFTSKKANARNAKVPFTLVFEDMVWPTHCPALGTKLEYVAGANGRGQRSPEITPSFDRIDPAIGYTPQNTLIISLLANQIKSNATHDQIRKVSEWLGRVAWENPA